MKTTSACFAVLRRLRGIRRSVPRRTVFQSPVSGATAAGLLQCSVGWHSTTPCTALAIGVERGRTTRLRVIKVRPHHGAPTPITLAESSMADTLQLTAWPSWFTNVFVTWHRHTLPTNFTIQQSRSFEGVCVPLHLMNCLFSVPDCQPIRRPSFSSRCCTVLEKSSAAYHICSVTSFLLLSLEDILLQTLLPVIVDQDRHDSINENDIS